MRGFGEEPAQFGAGFPPPSNSSTECGRIGRGGSKLSKWNGGEGRGKRLYITEQRRACKTARGEKRRNFYVGLLTLSDLSV